jgi:hypothetical protein
MKIDISLIIAFGVLFLLGLTYFIFGPKLAVQPMPGQKRTFSQNFFKYLPVFAVVCILAVVFILNNYYSKQVPETQKAYEKVQKTLNNITENRSSGVIKDSVQLLEERKKKYNQLEKAYVKLKEVDSIAKKEAFITGKNAIDPNLVQSQVKSTNDELERLSSLTPRVYIQIANESQRERAKVLASLLDSIGFNVPGIENIEGKANAPFKTQVRYSSTGEFKEARDILNLIKASIPELIQDKPVKIPPGKSRARHYEIWFSKFI